METLKTQFKIIPLFPIPLYTNKLPKQLILDHSSLLNKEKINNEVINSKEFGKRSINTYILNQDIYKNLSNYILQHATNYIQNYLSYNYKNYKFSQSWVSVKQPSEEHLPHQHPNSLVSGVLFFEENIKDTSNITFLRDDNFSNTINHHPTNRESLNSFSYNQYTVEYENGILLLFPSNLPHKVSENITNTSRKSLAFNIIPRDGFGAEEGLNELKFN